MAHQTGSKPVTPAFGGQYSKQLKCAYAHSSALTPTSNEKKTGTGPVA